MMISVAKFTAVFLSLFVLLRLAAPQLVSNNSKTNDVHVSTFGSTLRTPTQTPAATGGPAHIRHRQASSTQSASFCLAPQQPTNGEYKLEKDSCEDNYKDCVVPEGESLEPGSQLAYTCNSGYRATGKTDVTCRRGRWSAIPSCVGELSDGRGEIARKKCIEYANSMDFDTCPHSFTDKEESIYLTGKVLARDMEFPHMAVVGYNTSDSQRWVECNGGGTLISESFVITAASCLSNDSNIVSTVRLGIRNQWDEDVAMSEERRVIEVIRHPDYTAVNKYYDDIALLRLETPVRFNNRIRPACLHTSPTVETKEATATGWGYPNNRDDETTSDNLLKVLLPLVDWPTCHTAWPRDAFRPNGVIQRQSMCAGAEGRITCGDLGGPLVVSSKMERCTYDVVGIYNFGARNCIGSKPSVFFRIYHYLPWIEQVVWGKTLDDPQ